MAERSLLTHENMMLRMVVSDGQMSSKMPTQQGYDNKIIKSDISVILFVLFVEVWITITTPPMSPLYLATLMMNLKELIRFLHVILSDNILQ